MTRKLLTAVLLAACPSALLQADIIYSEFGPGMSFDPDGGSLSSMGNGPGTLLASQEFNNAMAILGGRQTTRRSNLLAAVEPADVMRNYNNMLESGYSELEFGLWQTLMERRNPEQLSFSGLVSSDLSPLKRHG
jgi:hypothetical protein